MQKDKLETERLVIKMLLIASNELNNEKLTHGHTKNSQIIFISNCIFHYDGEGCKIGNGTL